MSRKTREVFARMGGGILVASLSMALVDRRLGLKRFSSHFLIQFSKLNKNMTVWIIQVGTKLEKFNFIKNRRKIEFFTPFKFFRFFERKEVPKKSREHIFSLAVKFSIEWCINGRKKKFCSNLALRAPYIYKKNMWLQHIIVSLI